MGASKFIPIVGELNEEALTQFAAAFHRADRTPGPIILQISSTGGAVDVGCAMYDLIRTSQNQVVTIGVGIVASMSVLLLIAGDHRVLTEGTTLLIHDGDVHVENSLLKAKAYMTETLRLHDWYCKQIADRTGIGLKTVDQYASAETFITADHALQVGLVDEVRPYRKLKKLKLPRGSRG